MIRIIGGNLVIKLPKFKNSKIKYYPLAFMTERKLSLKAKIRT
jgi:hypothetical protein